MGDTLDQLQNIKIKGRHTKKHFGNNINTVLVGGRFIHVLAIGGGIIQLLWLSCISKKGVGPDLLG